MNKNILATLPLLAALLVMTGCATVTRGTSEVLVIESEPPGAEVEITPANQRCKTPCTAKLRRKDNQLVSIRRDGYEPVQVNIQSQVAGAGAAGMAGNVILGGLIGLAVDAGSGATKELKPNPVKVNLVAVPSTPVAVVPAKSSAAVDPTSSPASTPAVVDSGNPGAAVSAAPPASAPATPPTTPET